MMRLRLKPDRLYSTPLPLTRTTAMFYIIDYSHQKDFDRAGQSVWPFGQQGSWGSKLPGSQFLFCFGTGDQAQGHPTAELLPQPFLF